MKYATAGAFRTALEQRLANLARETGVPLLRLRKLVVFDRLLARLIAVAPDRFVLKGAVALHLRVGAGFRTTKDVDLGRQDNEEAANADFLAAPAIDLGDHFGFDIRRTGRLDTTIEGTAVRYHATAELAGRPFEEISVDVSFGDPPGAQPDLVRGLDLLGFAGIPPVEVPSLPLEQHVAEKVHAYTRTYGVGEASTRVKDLIDLVMIESSFDFLAGRLRLALQATFDARASHPVPAKLPPPPHEWRTAYRRMAAEVGLDLDVAVGYGQAGAFLDPVLAQTVADDSHWNPNRQAWQAARHKSEDDV
ncbi:MAG: nucleotidyl transferase AbiEii/AbiGii toxin family protein [Dehalococcoidia bacterium]